ncbi:MAG: ABC transporter substrate-binding protein [Actinobacteria bacterium]|nr:ABC transporter substrate-binding protein [Actinomycetota bacterium]
MRRIGVLALCLLLVVSLALTGCSKKGEDKKSEENVIKVGVLQPLSGDKATLGLNGRKGWDMAIDEINEAGGIKSLGGAKIKTIYADTRGDAKIGMSEAERLITKEGVVALMGAHQSSVTYPSTEVAEKYQIPYIVPVAIMDEITERGFKYTFRIAPKASQYAQDQIKFVADMSKASGKEAKKLALVFENSDWGQSSAKGWRKEAPKYGLEIVLDEAYPSSASDLMPVVMKIKKAQPDVIVFNSYTSDAILLNNGIAEQKINTFGMIGGGSGHADPEYIKNTGKNSNFHFDLTEWAPDIGRPFVKEKNEKFKKLHGFDLYGEAAENYAAGYVLADALERAASKDPKKIRDALAQTKLTNSPGLILPYDRIEFDQNGQNTAASLIIIQIQDGKRKTIWPPVATPPENKAVWPVPKWEERK